MPRQQQAVLLHQPIDPLGVDGLEAGGSPLALEARGEPPVPIAWPGVHQAPDTGREFCISGAGLGTTLPALASCSLNQIGWATPSVSAILFTGYPTKFRFHAATTSRAMLAHDLDARRTKMIKNESSPFPVSQHSRASASITY
jgi:hypothetical protein